MTRALKKDRSAQQMRQEAESQVSRDGPGRAHRDEHESERLLHELRVHQVELEMQNEELRAAQIELQDSRDRYWELYDHAPFGYLTLDADGRIVDANLTAAALLGLERGRLLGTRLSAYVHESDAGAFHLHRQETLAHETKQGCDVRIRRRPHGPVFPAHLDSVPHLQATGAAAGKRHIHTVLIDLSELRHAQADARASVSRTHTLLETGPDAIVTMDERGCIESVNAAAERLFGYAEAELGGASVTVLMPGLVLGEHEGDIAPAGREEIGVMKDGSLRPIEIGVGEWWDHGTRKLTVIIRDISARKQLHRQLEENEARFRQIAERIEDAFYLREPSGAITYVSPAYERIWGRSAADLIGKQSAWLDTVHEEDRPRVVQTWQRMRQGLPLQEVYRIRRLDGKTRWVVSRAFPVAEADGAVLRYVGVIRDITAERELEERLRQSQKMEAVGTLASGIAHNLRNVLQAIVASLDVVRLTGTGTQYGTLALTRAERASARGATLIDQLMAFARKQETAAKRVLVDAVVRETAELIKPLIGDSIVVQIATGAPEGVVLADSVGLEQILLNLAANARDAMPGGGTFSIATAEIALDEQAATRHSLAGAGRYVRIVVRDTGSGMDEATCTRIFEPFFTTKEVGKGTGLGLSTVFAVTTGLGGSIDVASEKDKGTTFTLYLPCCDDR